MLVMDTNTIAGGASTQYTNFDFNSMVNFNGMFLCASSSGLFEHIGDDDDGENIDAYFEPGTTDFGVSNPKRIPSLYLGGEADGVVTITVSTEMVTAKTLTVDSMSTQTGRKISGRRDVFGRYWTFKVANMNGCDFSIDQLEIIALILSHGRGNN